MEFRILGPLEVHDGDNSVPLGPTKERALLAVLLLQVSAVVSRERLIEELWGESPPPTAAKALNVHVSQLRKRLSGKGDDPIVTRPPGYSLVLDAERLDSARFERLVAEARGRAADGELASARTLLREALSLWRGPALDGIELESATRNQVRRLEELRIGAQMDRIDCDLALGMHEQVIGELTGLVAEHPLKERLHGQLILALYRAGRQADALQAYRDAREKLVGELGIEPSAALQRLERGILNQDPALEAPAGVSRSEHPPPPSAVRARRAWDRRLTLAGTALLAIVAAGIAAVLGAGSKAHPTLAANSLAAVDASGRLASVTPVGAVPSALAFGGGSVWVLNRQDGTVTRVNASTGDAEHTLSVRGTPIDVTAGEGAIWVIGEVDGRGAVERIDPGSGAVRWTTRIGRLAPRAIAAGEGGVWVADQDLRGSGGVLLRLSPRTGRIARTIRLPSKPSALAVGPAGVYVAALLPSAPSDSARAGAIYVVDPASGRLVARTTAAFVPGPGVSSIATDPLDGTGWLAGGLDTVFRLEPGNAAVRQRLKVPRPAVGVAFSGNALWALSRSGMLSEFNPRTGGLVHRTSLPTRDDVQATAIVAGDRRVWVAFERAVKTPRLRARSTTASTAVAGGPTRIRFGAGSAWVKNLDRTLSRIDPHTRRVVATISIGTGWGDVGFGFGSVWATSFDDNLIARIDPKTNRIVALIRTRGVAPLGVAVARGAVWVANHHADARGTGSVVRIDPRTNRVVARIRLGAQSFCCGPDNMTAADGDVWVDIPNEQLVVRIDARRNRVRARIPVPTGCGQLAAGAGSVWVADGCSAQILRIDPRTNRIVDRIDTGGGDVYPLAFAGGSLWTTTDDLRLLRIDPATDTIIDTLDVAPATRPDEQGPWFAAGAGALWLADNAGNRVIRLTMPR